ncbi:toxin VasX [Thalassospira sp.]|uniref:toxin VasX n=1 Tax=Thalassospira sp. TaxID=1912094 RepID=UPI003AA8EA66
MEYGDFSANADSEETFFPCQRGMIPILPVRFSLLPYDLDSVQEPISIGNPGSYIIRTLRRGFVYVYVENPQETDDATDRNGPGVWHVYRFETKGQDVNSDFVPSGTDNYNRADFSFNKYKWSDAYGAEDWKYDETVAAQKFIEVRKSSSKVWLAYSEYRWPSKFFQKAHQESFRKQIMQPVNLRGQNQWAAYIGKAEELVEEYKPAPLMANPLLLKRLNLSQVKFAPSIPPKISDECGVVVALHDPLGDIREMHHRLASMIEHRSNFSTAYKYPLTIGRYCDVLKDKVDPRDGMWDSLVGNPPAFADGWDKKYNSLVSDIKEIEKTTDELVDIIQKYVTYRQNFFLGKHMELGFAEDNDPDAAGYASMLFQVGVKGLGATVRGHLALRDALKEDDLKDDDKSELRVYLKSFLKAWGGFKVGVYDKVRRSRLAFDGVIEAFALELAAEGSMHEDPWRRAFQNAYRRKSDGTLMVQTVRLSYDDAVKFLQGGFSDPELQDLNARIDSSGNLQVNATDTQRPRMPDVDVPAAEIDGKFTLVGGLNAERSIVAFDGASAGVGMLLGAWSLFELAKAEQEAPELFKKGEISAVLTDNKFALATTAVGIADSMLTFGTRMSTAYGPTERIAGDALSTLYKKALPQAANKLSYAPRMGMVGGVGRMVSTWLPRVSLVLGALMSFGAIVRGAEREDRAEIIGNSAMLAGTLLLAIPGANVAVAVGAALIIATGFAITLLSYSNVEDIIRKSFWGSSDSYWDYDERPEISDLIEEAKSNFSGLEGFYNEETHRFEDLFWGIDIENKEEGDGIFTVSSPAFKEDDPGDVSIKLMLFNEYVDVQYSLSNGEISGFNKDYISVSRIGGVPEIIVRIKRDDQRGSPYHKHTVHVEYTRSETGKKLSASSGRIRSF